MAEMVVATMATTSTTIVDVLANTDSTRTMHLCTTIDAGILFAGRGGADIPDASRNGHTCGNFKQYIVNNGIGGYGNTAGCLLTVNAG